MSKKNTNLNTLNSNLKYIRANYKKLILKNLMAGKPTNRLVERLKAVEIQIWMAKESQDGQKKTVSNG